MGQTAQVLHHDLVCSLLLRHDFFDNLLPLSARLNRLKSNGRFETGAEHFFKMLAKGRAIRCLEIYEGVNHIKRTVNRTDPASIDVDKLAQFIGDSYTWKKKHVLAVVKAYIRQNVKLIRWLASRFGKTLNSVRAKLVNLRVYNPDFLQISAV